MEDLLHFSALGYLNMWIEHDSRYVQGLGSSNSTEKRLATMKDAMTYYKVARTLPTLKKDNEDLPRYKKLLEILDKIAAPGPDPSKTVEKLKSKIKEVYDRNLLSLTTKALWLMHHEGSVIIYDSRARKALEGFNNGKKLDEYSTYYNEWMNQYKKYSDSGGSISTAIRDLENNLKYAINKEKAEKIYGEGIPQQDWFKKRVFDVYLWYRGG